LSGGWLVVCGTRTSEVDALHAYSEKLVAALGDAGVASRMLSLGPDGGPAIDGWRRHRDEIAAADVVLIQYNPFSFGWNGFAPWLAFELARLRRRRGRPTIGLMCHETFTPWGGVKRTITSAYQRLQLARIVPSSDHVFVSIGIWGRDVPALRRARAIHQPVGSNLPDRRGARDRVRAELGVSDRDVVVVSFGTGHPSAQDSLIERSSRRMVDAGIPILLLSLGAGRTSALGGALAAREVLPGRLREERLAELMSAGDLYLCTYVDGVSTRRGTVMAALQHSVPVLSTSGRSTDAELRSPRAGLALVDADRGAEAFAQLAVELARDPDRRAELARQGREYYEQRCDWPAIASAMVARVAAGTTP
jgi:glycosyltransferase involved in cell wall biosynthesis